MRNVWLRLRECGLTAQCKLVTAKPASMEDTSVVCKDSYFTFHGAHPWSHHQLDKARIAAGTVTELALLVAQGNLKNGFAIVQKLKHHDALELPLSKLMSSFSSVAVAAKQLQQSVKKILIVDWDVHHRSTVQELFYTDPRVLYISLHQYCETMASSKRGGPNEVGLGEGEGFNVNVPWSGHLDSPIGDTEYMEAFRTVVMPIAHEFSPDMVLVSSEFNAVDGHPASQGGYRVSAKCFGVLTQKLMKLARGRVVVVLECDHDLNAICDASEECINALLYRKTASLSDDVFQKKPCANAVRSLQKVLQIQSKYWSSVRFLTQTGLWLEAERKCSADNDAPKALSSLSLGHNEPAEHDEDELPMWEKTG
ncbi:histone deacetylase 4 [Trichomycterus rosablanca]|uniref:histone deacetylase 4 n=1 Tax=Trichomycterus rosablanca TaxID=2290929 RepID=UPI002F35C14D